MPEHVVKDDVWRKVQCIFGKDRKSLDELQSFRIEGARGRENKRLETASIQGSTLLVLVEFGVTSKEEDAMMILKDHLPRSAGLENSLGRSNQGTSDSEVEEMTFDVVVAQGISDSDVGAMVVVRVVGAKFVAILNPNRKAHPAQHVRKFTDHGVMYVGTQVVFVTAADKVNTCGINDGTVFAAASHRSRG